MADLTVFFIVMPFAPVESPSIGVSLLKSGLTKMGVECRIYYANLDFAEKVGLGIYQYIAERTVLEGEWIFSNGVFGPIRNTREARLILEERYRSAGVDKETFDLIYAQLLSVQLEAVAFVNEFARTVKAGSTDIVGFTCTYNQTCASLAVARELKERNPSVTIVLGGVNCERPMGAQLLNFPFVDYVCCGEGDKAFIDFVRNHLDGRGCATVNGILSRQSDPNCTKALPILDMDSLPIPDYSDFVERFKRSRFHQQVRPYLLMETSRGCWWGEKSQCTFCSLSESSVKYRSKSAQRVLQELRELTQKYEIARLKLTDNILDLRYFNCLLPRIAESGMQLDLFCEVKASLTRDQLEILRNAGMRRIQPGIESLSDPILKLMKKGTTVAQNIQLLKWCRRLGIIPYWNFLYGFPGEPPEEYRRMATLIPLIEHLPPPDSYGPVNLYRFSPYFSSPQSFGLENVRPNVMYEHIFPFDQRRLFDLAFFFDFDFADGRTPTTYTCELRSEIERWWSLWRDTPPQLSMHCEKEFIVIKDTRSCKDAEEITLAGDEAIIYEHLNRTPNCTPRILESQHKSRFTAQRIREIIRDLEARNLLIRLGETLVGLAIESEKSSNSPF